VKAQSASSIAIAIGIAFGVTTLTVRGLTLPVETPVAAATELAYTPASLRPELEAPDETRVPQVSTYTVREGDSLLSVAYRFGSTVEAISLASNLTSQQLIRTGQELIIPPARSTLQTVEPGTSTATLAATFGVDTAVLTAYNGIAAPADQPLDRNVVILPPSPMDARNSMLVSTNRSTAGQVSSGANGDSVYTVAQGDTLLGIAYKLGLEPEDLIAFNGITDTNRLAVGQTLWSQPARDGDTMVRTASIGNSAPSAPAAIQPPAPTVYQVAPGDTVEQLADRFGVDTWTIVNNNELRSADTISVGAQLTILPVSGLLYTVQPGDTLAGIAARYQVDLGPIIDFNYLSDADYIAVGMELILPGASPIPPAAPATVPNAPQAPTVYVVAPGDTVYSIAKRFSIEPSDLVVANRMTSADRLSVGEQLKIVPGAAGSSSASRSGSPSQQTVTRNLPVPGPSSSSVAVRPSASGGSVTSIAMGYKGSRYVFGGTTPAGFDCSGFVYYVMNKAGNGISRGMWGQYNAGPHPSRGDLQPGDLVFFQNTYMAGLSHNGIYLGGGQFIHASDERTGVTISNLSDSYWSGKWFGATRIN